MLSAGVCVRVPLPAVWLAISWAVEVRAADKTGGKSFEEFKPRDVKSGEYPDYDKYVDMPNESSEETLWRKVLRADPNSPKVSSFSVTWSPNQQQTLSETSNQYEPPSNKTADSWENNIPSVY